MTNLPDRLSNCLLQPWTTNGMIIFRGRIHCVEVEVPMLALDAEELARAIMANVEYVRRPGYPQEALGPDVTAEQHFEISKVWRRELTIASHDLTLAAAVLARRAHASPLRVTVDCLDLYAGRHFWRGGTTPGDPALVELLFILDGTSPTIYVSSDALAAVTRYVGTEFLSILVTVDELRLRIEEAKRNLEHGSPPTPRSITNLEDWLSSQGHEEDNEN